MMLEMYQVKKPSRCEFVPIRQLNYHVRLWGHPQPGQAPLFLMHGWMDVSASFQFVVDALRQERWVIAPDWRGYGRTQTPDTDHFWFPDYLADLDFLLDHYSPNAPVDLLGHSMGGNVVMQYAGIFPERVRRLINLEGFGMARTQPAQAPGRYAKWIGQLKQFHRDEMDLRAYPDLDGVAQRLRKTNPRLSPDKAEWLAGEWADQDAQGQWRILGHAAHKIINATLYRVEEVDALFKRIAAPTLVVEASDNSINEWWKGAYTLDEFHARLTSVAQLQMGQVTEAGHMLHHDQPEQVATLIEHFIA
jgi:pimeloyl-ACP methyl ester carboxylesterase